MAADVEYDVFLSYAREDRERALWFVSAFEKCGLRVFWDEEDIPPGTGFPAYLEEKLQRSRFVVVLWTETSVGKEWVEIEAREGKKRKVLRPVFLDPIAPDSVPFGLQYVQYVSLSDWDGSSDHPVLTRLVDSLATPTSEGASEEWWDFVTAAGLAGMTRYGPVDYPGGPEGVLPGVQWSYEDFEHRYGGHAPLQLAGNEPRAAYAALTARAFFDGGGRKLYFSRVYSPVEGASDGIARCELPVTTGRAGWVAMWPGSGGNLCVEARVQRSPALVYRKHDLDRVQVRRAANGEILELQPADTPASDERPLLLENLVVVRRDGDGPQTFLDAELREVTLEAGQQANFLRLSVSISDGPRLLQSFEELSTRPNDEEYFAGRLAQRCQAFLEVRDGRTAARRVWPMVWLDSDAGTEVARERECATTRLLAALPGRWELAGGHDGKLASPGELEGEASGYSEGGTGLAALQYDDIEPLLLPDGGAFTERDMSVAAMSRLVERAQDGYGRIAVVDAPLDAADGEVLNFKDRLPSSGRAALFHRWLELDTAEEGAVERTWIPPSGFAAAGICARSPLRGQDARPEEPHGTLRVRCDRSGTHVETLELDGINVLRVVEGRATLAPTARSTDESELFGVNRLKMHILKCLARRSLDYFFLPLDQELRSQLETDAGSFLQELSRRGVLDDASGGSFRVSCEEHDGDSLLVSLEFLLAASTRHGPRWENLVMPFYAGGGAWREVFAEEAAERGC